MVMDLCFVSTHLVRPQKVDIEERHVRERRDNDQPNGTCNKVTYGLFLRSKLAYAVRESRSSAYHSMTLPDVEYITKVDEDHRANFHKRDQANHLIAMRASWEDIRQTQSRPAFCRKLGRRRIKNI